MGKIGPQQSQCYTTHLYWVSVSFLQIVKLLEWTHGYIWSKVPPKLFYTSPLSSKDIFLEIKEFLEWTH